MLEVFRLECRSDDTFLDGVMQARLCVRLRSLRFFLRGESVVEIALQGSEIVTGWLQSAYGIMESLSF